MPLEETLDHLRTLYAADPDPWRHDQSRYEREKHTRTVKAAGDGPFRQVVEIGCGTGALTARLAPLCDRLTALEAVPEVLATARVRMEGQGHVTVAPAVVPHDLPELSPDLVVLSEVLYFLTPQDIAALGGWIGTRAAPGARIVAVNWTGDTGHALGGPEAVDLLRQSLTHATWEPQVIFPGHVIDCGTCR
ncbi:SAM-dependent methyltransferase [Tranquillimonas alkanivorans]|uniref:Nodulation protein S (NodS) n=1 Tax=Tranquillimonas alkanivorans TaxID=441119 RepID=A0A1I5SBV1_9RHOB|nr:SAM-dependent methyltransferase [Tranquillimonas alkanivorans]SFP68007.1 Nodulation protein S (NodS) [Tranquillimonas alkanivorans]